jgi:hypothetical protein
VYFLIERFAGNKTRLLRAKFPPGNILSELSFKFTVINVGYNNEREFRILSPKTIYPLPLLVDITRISPDLAVVVSYKEIR